MGSFERKSLVSHYEEVAQVHFSKVRRSNQRNGQTDKAKVRLRSMQLKIQRVPKQGQIADTRLPQLSWVRGAGAVFEVT